MPVSLTAKDVMDSKVVSMDGSSSVNDAILKMVQSDTWSLIVEVAGLPEGVVTDRDILRRCLGKGGDPSRMKIKDIMSSPVVSVDPGERLGAIMDLMVEKNIRRVFVSENGKVIGKITQTKLFDDTINVMESLTSLRYQM
ncbi:MAG TPA: CBS domain-containing protein [Nitrososphaerales archaeon]|nr:CBS domain-containing protein [Nitrososphaerales archaeon]